MHYREITLTDDGHCRLDCYLMDTEITTGGHKTRPAIIIAPGGAYLTLAHREAEPVAARFLGLGFQAFVLRYHTYVVGPAAPGTEPTTNPRSHYPVQVVDAMRAMDAVHAMADEFCIDRDRIYALGFSAGAHVMGSLAERFDDEELLKEASCTPERARPAGLVLCYPMVSADLVEGRGEFVSDLANLGDMIRQAVFGDGEPCARDIDRMSLTRHVRPDMPRTFVWQTAQDTIIDPSETTEFVCALQHAHVPCEYHLFERGPHGMGLCDATSASDPSTINDEAAAWCELCARWLALDDAEAL